MDYWCEECKERLEYEDCEKSREYYEAWGHEFYTESLICPHCRSFVVPYEWQDEKEEDEEWTE